MQTFTSLEEARAAEALRAVPFVEIHRVADDVWQAYEETDPLPPDL